MASYEEDLQQFKRLGFCGEQCSEWPVFRNDINDPQAELSLPCWADDAELAALGCMRAWQTIKGLPPWAPVQAACPISNQACNNDLQTAVDRV